MKFSNSYPEGEGEDENHLCLRKPFNLLFVQLKAVGPVAVLGGLLQILTFMFLCAITAVVLYSILITSFLLQVTS